MPKITVLPHPDYSPLGTHLSVDSGVTICDALLENGVDIDHACGKVGACTTCHVILRSGFDSLNPSEDSEEDMLDRAWGLQATSRLSCQAKIGSEDLEVEIPKYSLNHVKESA